MAEPPGLEVSIEVYFILILSDTVISLKNSISLSIGQIQNLEIELFSQLLIFSNKTMDQIKTNFWGDQLSGMYVAGDDGIERSRWGG